MSQQSFRRLAIEVDQRAGSDHHELFSVSIARGLIPRTELTADEARADDLSNYKVFEPGDIVLNKMRAFQGALGLAARSGIVSPDYAVLRPTAHVDGVFLMYVMRSRWFVGEMISRLRGIGGVTSGLVRTPRVNISDLGEIAVRLPLMAEQRQIADFLDDRISRIDRIIEARRLQIARFEASLVTRSFDAIRGVTEVGSRKAVGSAWLEHVPHNWPILTVATEFFIDLGKMLDEKRQTGQYSLPYLRNTNVQWDRVDKSDLKSMDIGPGERARFTLEPGDLMICEGGQPGRAAIWDGSISPIGYQKALHRARSRGRSNVAWLLECLRVAVHMNVFAVENGQTTIGHLTNEQLRAQRFPFPDPAVQERLVLQLSKERSETGRALADINRSIQLLTAYKSSLIVASVTGEIDVTAAGSGTPG